MHYLRCKKVEEKAEHTRSYDSTWKFNESQHWHECACGAKADVAVHIPGNWIIDQIPTATQKGSQHQECIVCTYITKREEIPSTDNNDFNGSVDNNDDTSGETGSPSSGSSSGIDLTDVTTGSTTQNGQSTTKTLATPSVSIDDGTASAEVSASMGNEIVKQAKNNDSELVVIELDISGNISRAEVSIPATTVNGIAYETNAILTVTTPVASVTIPNSSLPSVASKGDNVTATVEIQGNIITLEISADGQTVDAAISGITLMIPDDDTTVGTVAFVIHENGMREVIRKSMAEGDSVTVPLDGSETIVIVDNSKDFNDVSLDSWYKNAVDFATGHELFNGTTATTFEPNSNMTRGMLVQVLYNMESNPATDTDATFSDIASDCWYADAVEWAINEVIINGYENGEFGANDSITREQVAVMLYRYAWMIGYDTSADSDLNIYTDASQISPYAITAMQWASAKGLITGDTATTINPLGNATRAEAAQILMTFCENVAK